MKELSLKSVNKIMMDCVTRRGGDCTVGLRRTFVEICFASREEVEIAQLTCVAHSWRLRVNSAVSVNKFAFLPLFAVSSCEVCASSSGFVWCGWLKRRDCIDDC